MGRLSKLEKDRQAIENRVSIVIKQLRILGTLAAGKADVLIREDIDLLKETLKREVQSTTDKIYIQVDLLEKREDSADNTFNFRPKKNED